MKKKLFFLTILVILFSLTAINAYADICDTQTIIVQPSACNREYVDVTVSGRYYMNTDEAVWCGANFGDVEIDIYLYESDWSSFDDLIDQHNGIYKAVESPMFCNYVDYSHTFNVRLSDFAGGLEGSTIEIYGKFEPINGPYTGDCSTPEQNVDIISGQCGSGVCCDLSTCNFKSSSNICANNVQTDYGCPWGTSPGNDVGVQRADRYCSGTSSSCSGSLQWDSWTIQDNCDSNEMCIDNNPSCQNVQCNSNSDCGTTGWINSPYCSGTNVYQTYRTYTCSNPGTPSSSCSYDDNNLLKESCTTCSGGACVVECNDDSDCGTGGWWINDYHCDSGDVWNTWRTDKCYNPGNLNSYCDYSNSEELYTSCPNGCSGGQCIIECSSNNDCGTDGLIGGPYCSGDDVYQAYRTYTCSNPGSLSSDCSYSDNPQLKENCPNTCMSGACTTIACYNNNDCGADSYINNEYCNGNDVWDTYRSYTCSNPGTESSSCSYSDLNQSKEICTSCLNGVCQVPICNSNSECGTDGWLSNEYCSGTDVWDSYRTYTCENPGTGNASCSYNDNGQLKQVCPGDCSNGDCENEGYLWYNDVNSHWKMRKLSPDGIADSFEFNTTFSTDLVWDGTYLWTADANTNKIYKLTTDGTIVDSIDTPGCGSPSGLAWDEPDLWVVDCDIYKITTAGAVIDSFSAPGSTPFGLAYDGTYLWNANWATGNYTIFKLTTAGVVVDSFPAPGVRPNGLAWDGTYLWNADSSDDKIYKLETNGTIVDSIDAPGPVSKGLAWDGTYLWNSDYSTDKIYKLGALIETVDTFVDGPYGITWDGAYLWQASFSDNKIYRITTSGASTGLSFNSPGSMPTGLAWDGTYIWNADENGQIYKLTTSGTVVDNFSSPGLNPQGLTWDGTYLWHADANSDTIYKLDTNGIEIDSFASPGGGRPSGLAWDGIYLWFIDYIDNKIYKLTTDGTVIDSLNSPTSSASGLAWQPLFTECSSDLDCGINGWLGSDYCSGGNVWDTNRTSACYNPGTVFSYCSQSDNEQLKDSCSDICEDGACASVGCYSNSECDTDGWQGNDFCNGTEVWDTWRENICNDPGTGNSSCSYLDNNISKKDCPNGCAGGSCIIKCDFDSDCGTDGLLGNGYCNGTEVWDTYRTHTCSNPATISASCSYVDDDLSKETCPSGCSEGSCIIECSSSSECGTDHWLGYDFCSSGDVWDDYKEYTCSDAGTKFSSCSESESSQLKETCDYGCSGGECQTPECFDNSDCGTDGWLGKYCSGTEVWDSYRTHTCSDAGTISASCSYVDNDQLQETCTYDCGSGACLFPDLVVKHLLKQGPASPFAGGNVVLAFMLENIGDIAVNNIDWELDFGDTNVLTGTVSGLDAGETSSIVMRKNTYTAAGAYNPAVTVDYSNAIEELDETNNNKNMNLDIS